MGSSLHPEKHRAKALPRSLGGSDRPTATRDPCARNSPLPWRYQIRRKSYVRPGQCARSRSKSRCAVGRLERGRPYRRRSDAGPMDQGATTVTPSRTRSAQFRWTPRRGRASRDPGTLSTVHRVQRVRKHEPASSIWTCFLGNWVSRIRWQDKQVHTEHCQGLPVGRERRGTSADVRATPGTEAAVSTNASGTPAMLGSTDSRSCPPAMVVRPYARTTRGSSPAR